VVPVISMKAYDTVSCVPTYLICCRLIICTYSRKYFQQLYRRCMLKRKPSRRPKGNGKCDFSQAKCPTKLQTIRVKISAKTRNCQLTVAAGIPDVSRIRLSSQAIFMKRHAHHTESHYIVTPNHFIICYYLL